jgi:hypothetical protein
MYSFVDFIVKKIQYGIIQAILEHLLKKLYFM